MSKVTSKLNLVFLFFLTCSPLPLSAKTGVSKEKPLIMAIFPRLNPPQSMRLYKPLSNYISHMLGRKIILKTPKKFSTFWTGLESGKYDIVHFNQYHYVKSRKEFGYEVIVKNIEFNESTIAGSIVVRKNSDIRHVSDLKGKNIVFGGGPQAMQSYIVARYLLEKNGLNRGEYTESFALNPPNAILSTYFRQSSAAGTGDKVLKLATVRKQIDINEMRFLVKGNQLAHLPWAVKKNFPENLKHQIQTILLKLSTTKNGRHLLKTMKLDGFARAWDSDYNPHRKIINEVLGEQY